MLEMYQQGSVEVPTLWMKLAKHTVWNVEEKWKSTEMKDFRFGGTGVVRSAALYGLTFLLDYERK